MEGEGGMLKNGGERWKDRLFFDRVSGEEGEIGEGLGDGLSGDLGWVESLKEKFREGGRRVLG